MYRKPHFIFIAALLMVIAGFFPTYFSKMDDAPLRHHIHGGVAMAWFCLLIAQAWLMSRGKIQWHRMLGRVSPLFALAVLATAIWIMRHAVVADIQRMPALFPKLYFTDCVMLVFFVFTYTTGIINRKNVHLHQRCMVLTILPLLPPALGRALFFYILYPMGYGFSDIWHPMMLIILALLFLAILNDKKRGHIFWPYPVAFGVFLLTYLIGSFAPQSEMILSFLNGIGA